MSARVTASKTIEVAASCCDCDWCSSALNSLGNAARHHDSTDHCVTVDITRRVVYGHEQTPEERGQLVIGGDV